MSNSLEVQYEIEITQWQKHIGRFRIDWDLFDQEAHRKGLSMKTVSVQIGQSDGYLSRCKLEGGLSLDIVEEVCDFLDIDPLHLLKPVSLTAVNSYINDIS